MFTSSPLYLPALTPRLPDAIDPDLSTYEGRPDVDPPATYQKPAYLAAEGARCPGSR